MATETSGGAVKIPLLAGKRGTTYHAGIGLTLRRHGLRLKTRTVQDTVYLWAVKAP